MSDLWSAINAIYLTKIRGHYRIRCILAKLRKPVIPDEIYKSGKKLNLGSSDRLLPNYTNVDALEERNPDIVCDVSKLDFASDNEYDLVRASHILEHFSFEEIKQVLSEWRRVLRMGGYLIVCVPNYKVSCWGVILKPSILELDEKTYKSRINGIFALDLPPQYRHKVVFTYKSLTKLLNNSGFRVISRINYLREEPFTLGIEDDSCGFFSLNLVAIKV
jgi:predicted SAM-dependent methyltransferase